MYKFLLITIFSFMRLSAMEDPRKAAATKPKLVLTPVAPVAIPPSQPRRRLRVLSVQPPRTAAQPVATANNHTNATQTVRRQAPRSDSTQQVQIDTSSDHTIVVSRNNDGGDNNNNSCNFQSNCVFNCGDCAQICCDVCKGIGSCFKATFSCFKDALQECSNCDCDCGDCEGGDCDSFDFDTSSE